MSTDQPILPKNTPGSPKRPPAYNDQETIIRLAQMFSDGKTVALASHLRSLDTIKAICTVMLLKSHFECIEHDAVKVNRLTSWLFDTAHS